MRLMHVIPNASPVSRQGATSRASSRTHLSGNLNQAQVTGSLPSQSYANDLAGAYGSAGGLDGGSAGVGQISPADTTLVKHTAANILLDVALLPDAPAHFAAKGYVKPLVQVSA